MSLKLPLDSVVVLPHEIGAVRSDVWSVLAAERIAALLAASTRLRTIPADRVRPLRDHDEVAPEEIGRQLSVNAAAVCAVRVHASCLDLELELIDVLAEAVIGRQTFLSSVADASRMHVQAARAIAGWMDQEALPFEPPGADDGLIAEIRVAASEERFDAAIALCRALDVRAVDPELRLEIARAIVDAPAGIITPPDIAIAKRALRGIDSPDSHELAARIAIRFERRWKRAITRFKAACAASDASRIHASFAWFLIAMRRFDEAHAQMRWVTAEWERAQLTMFLDAVLTGKPQEASDAMRASCRGAKDDLYFRAQQLAMHGRRAEASHALARAIDEHSPFAMFAAVDPAFESVRGTRAFETLVRHAGIA